MTMEHSYPAGCRVKTKPHIGCAYILIAVVIGYARLGAAGLRGIATAVAFNENHGTELFAGYMHRRHTSSVIG